MLTYHEYEEAVFNWLMSKHKENPNFTFTVRQSAGKGSETDYFIGTAKSSYFGTTFWTLPVSFPGSSADCINLIFQLSKAGYSYYFEFNQTQTPHDDQNKSALELIKALKKPLQKQFKFKRPVQEANKMYTIQIAAPEKNYGNLDFMLADIDKQISEIIQLTDSQIEIEKKKNPQFKAYRVTQEEFSSLIERLNNRIEKHGNSLQQLLHELGDQITQTYFNLLRRLINDLKLEESSQKIYFNYEKDKLIFGIGQRYVFNLENEGFFRMISKNEIISGGEEFKSDPKAYLTNYPFDYNIQANYTELFIAAKETLDITEKSGFYKFDKKDLRAMAFKMGEDNENDLLKNLVVQFPKNQILYGPPGTGKTYNTINKALEIIGIDIIGKNRNQLKEIYKEKVEEGQIVFTTFHQSLSYEDFVEGIKPIIEEDKEGLRSVVYEVQDGIFKSLCDKAKISTIKEEKRAFYGFDDAWNDLLSEMKLTEDAMDDFVLDILTPKKGLKVTEITDQGNLRLTPISVSGLDYTVSYTRAKKLQSAFPDLSVVKNIDKEFRAVIGGSNSTAYWAVINNLNKKITKNHLAVEVSTEQLRPHVLIIDEINRGNVSAIFGELITLIEESKRLGNSEAIEIMLPYSKTKFGVPDNVYIIGTMNTADRSVESLDTALRRRFSFEEMLPDPNLVSPEKMVFDLWWRHAAAEWDDRVWLLEEKNLYTVLGSQTLLQMDLIEKKAISSKMDSGTADETIFKEYFDNESLNLKIILEKINNRLEKLLSRDHTIGHSFFLGITTENDLYSAFFNKIIPLLQEYFFGDFGKVGLVLGSAFVEEVKGEANIFAAFEYEDRDLLLEKKVYRINDFKNDMNSFVLAVKAI